jgi:hypothetical protein
LQDSRIRVWALTRSGGKDLEMDLVFPDP